MHFTYKFKRFFIYGCLDFESFDVGFYFTWRPWSIGINLIFARLEISGLIKFWPSVDEFKPRVCPLCNLSPYAEIEIGDICLINNEIFHMSCYLSTLKVESSETLSVQAIHLEELSRSTRLLVQVNNQWYEAMREFSELIDHTVWANDFENWKKVERKHEKS